MAHGGTQVMAAGTLAIRGGNFLRGAEFLSKDLGLGGTWVQTSYNTKAGDHPDGKPYRKNFAGIGFKYEPGLKTFIPPKPHDSWNLDEESGTWLPPIPKPDDLSKNRVWNEQKKKWYTAG